MKDELKIHWTGCPNSCGQAYMGGIGLTGKKAKDKEGKTVEAYDISIGGSQGPNYKLGELIKKSVPQDELKDVLKDAYNFYPDIQKSRTELSISAVSYTHLTLPTKRIV